MRSFQKQIPNFLTSVRFLITPLIVWLVVRGNNYLALFLVLLGATSDILDGVLARKFNACSDFGRAFEHSVDKLYLAPIIYVTFRYLDINFSILIVILEIVTILFSVVWGKKDEQNWPNIWGKISYGFLIGASCTALIGANKPMTDFLVLGNTALAMAIASRVASFVVFFQEETIFNDPR